VHPFGERAPFRNTAVELAGNGARINGVDPCGCHYGLSRLPTVSSEKVRDAADRVHDAGGEIDTAVRVVIERVGTNAPGHELRQAYRPRVRSLGSER